MKKMFALLLACVILFASVAYSADINSIDISEMTIEELDALKARIENEKRIATDLPGDTRAILEGIFMRKMEALMPAGTKFSYPLFGLSVVHRRTYYCICGTVGCKLPDNTKKDIWDATLILWYNESTGQYYHAAFYSRDEVFFADKEIIGYVEPHLEPIARENLKKHNIFVPANTKLPTVRPSPTPTPIPTSTPSPRPTATPSPTPRPSPTPTATPKPTYTPSPTPTVAPTPVATQQDAAVPDLVITGTDAPIKEVKADSGTNRAFRFNPETKAPGSSNKATTKVKQTATPKPTAKVKQATPTPTAKPKKTATPRPTKKPTATPIPITSITLPETSGTVYVGKQVQLRPTIKPNNAANKKLIWASSDTSIATVNEKGLVKGVGVGNAIITASSADGPSVQYSATVRIAPVTLKVTYSAKCIAKNHVGNSWSKEFYLNDETVKGTGRINVENGDTITVGCWICENDSRPDEDSFTEEIEITPEIMTKGIRIERMVYVRENSGRYSGNYAEWSVVINIRP